MKKNKLFRKQILIIILFVCVCVSSKNIYAKSVAKDGIESFPESYKEYLYALQEKHPNWKFVSIWTNVNWSTAITNEIVDTRSLVPNSYPTIWKRDEIQIEPGWVNASKSAVAYTLDPRNSFTEEKIFQFETTGYNNNINNLAAVNQVLRTTPMMDNDLKNKYKNAGKWLDLGMTYSEAICNIGKNNGVSPVHLASRIKQETGGDIINNKSIYGSYPGYEGFYNFFNVKAYGSNPALSGLIYAKSVGWCNPIESINGGANRIYNNYTKWGQNTIYFEKWDVNDETGGQSLFWNQYMTNILAPTSESKIRYSSYVANNLQNEAFEFRIPVFDAMPEEPCQLIDSKLNIDSPKNGDIIKDIEIPIYGWFLSDNKNASIKIYIDGKEITEEISRGKRDDVINAYQGAYGGSETNPNPGYTAWVNTSGLKKGQHSVKVAIISSDGSELKSETRNFIIDREDTLLNVASPNLNTTYKSEIGVYGWYLSEDKDATLNIYIDNEKITEDISRGKRDDVINAYQGEYGGIATNPNPGYTAWIDTSRLSYGYHQVKIEIVSSKSIILAREIITVNVKEFESKLNVDAPQNNEKLYGDTLDIYGWYLSEDKEASLKIYIDNKIVDNTLINRYNRNDLDGILPNYGGAETNRNPGYHAILNTSDISYGNHSITVEIVSSKNKLLASETRNFEMKKYETLLNVDAPQDDDLAYESGIPIYGWYLSEDVNAKLRIYVDGKEIKEEVSRVKREDVINAYQGGYGGTATNPNPGYFVLIDTNELAYGNHIVKVEITTQAGRLLGEITRKIYLKPYDTKLNVDAPQNNDTNKKEVGVYGWYLSEDINSKLKIYVDDKEISENISRGKRDDVIKSYQGAYGGSETNPNPGYTTWIDISNLKDGQHTIKVEVISSSNKILETVNRNFVVKKYDTKLNVDAPQNNDTNKKEVGVYGWYLSEDINSKLKIYVDDKEISENISRGKRDDVIKSYQGTYGGAETNPNPGYTTWIDVSNLKDGVHIIRVEVLSSNDEVIDSITRNIIIEKYRGILNVDAPQNNDIIKTEVGVYGWYLSEDMYSNLKIYVDDKEISENISRGKRDDVINSYQGAYGGSETNPNPGYTTWIDISNLKDGIHTIKVEVISSKNDIIDTITRTINIKKYNSKLNVDAPQNNEKITNEVGIYGWFLSEDENTILEILVDGKEINEKISRGKRDDVINAYQESYGGSETNPNPGYTVWVNTSSLKSGQHTVEVNIKSSLSNEILDSITRKIMK